MTRDGQGATLTLEMSKESEGSMMATKAYSTTEVRRERILVPVEGTPECETSIPVAQQLARAVDAEICLLRVVEVNGTFSPLRSDPNILRIMDEAARYLGELEPRFKLPEDRTRHLVRWSDDVAREISTIAEKEGIDLIVMVSHCRNWLERLTQVSVSNEVRRAGVCPVLCVPVPRPEASRRHRAMAATRP